MKTVHSAVVCLVGMIMMTVLAISGQAVAAETKIGVIDMQEVLTTSNAGKKAQGLIEQKMKALQESFKKDENALVALQKDMEKKGAAWSDTVKREKAEEFQKKRRDLATKQEQANEELKKLREENVNPILKKLKEVVDTIGRDGDYALIVPRNVVLYAPEGDDITAKVTAELNKVMK